LREVNLPGPDELPVPFVVGRGRGTRAPNTIAAGAPDAVSRAPWLPGLTAGRRA